MGPRVQRVPRGEAEGVLQVAPAGEDGNGKRVRSRHRTGNVAAAAAQHGRPAGDDARDRVVAGRFDLAVVDEQDIGNRAQTRESAGIRGHDRVTRQVAGGHHQRAVRVREQEVMERRVGQQQPDPGVARRDLRGNSRGLPQLRDDDGPLRRREEPLLFGPEARQSARGLEIAHHDREGLFVAPLALPQPRDRQRRSRVASQMKPAEPLDRDDEPGLEGPRGLPDRILPVEVFSPRRDGGQARTADGACIRLGMEAPVERDRRTRAGRLAHMRNGAMVVAGRS